MRYKNRFLVFELLWRDGKRDESLNEGALLQASRDAIQTNFGDLGLGSSMTSFQVKYWNPFTNICVLRCGRDSSKKAVKNANTISEKLKRLEL
eukprot:gene13396-19247_t